MYKYIKRFFDFVSALLALIVFSLLLAVVAVLVKIKLGSPVIFKQERPGLNNKVFTLYKFRTMTDERNENGELFPDEVRLTKFGQFLRNTSIDELPELINILKGDMSVIGPRPLLVQYIPLYNKHQARRAEVKPGLSGWAQVNGRNSVTWEDKFDMDVYYADNYSLALDFKILLMTVKNVIKREGISSDTSATMEPFTGTPKKKEETQNV